MNTLTTWLGYISLVAMLISMLGMIIFGAMLAFDKDRGEPVSATAPYVRAFSIALGMTIISAAGALAGFFL